MTTKFERDKVYKTRDGREARVICVDAPDRRPIIALIRHTDNSGWATQSYFADGSIWTDGVSAIDLILPKPEPIVEWGTVGPTGFLAWSSESVARAWLECAEYKGTHRLAKRTTEIVE